MPFIENEESLHKYGKHSAIQFAVDDFDNDGISDIYLNFDNHWGHIPKKWKEEGVRTKNVVMRFPGNTLTIRDY
jgi:hypothetical protein